jgi:hypothetical protein
VLQRSAAWALALALALAVRPLIIIMMISDFNWAFVS